MWVEGLVMWKKCFVVMVCFSYESQQIAVPYTSYPYDSISGWQSDLKVLLTKK